MFITGAAFTRRAFAVFLEPQSTRILPGLMANLNRTNNPQKHIMKYNTKWLAAPLGIASGLFIASSAMAATVLIDFGNNTSFRGVSVPNPDPNGNFWNSLQPGLFYQNLVGTSNTATTIDLGFSTPVGTDSYNGPAGVTSDPPTAAEIAATDIDTAALGILGVKEAAFDYAATPAPNTPARFEIQQLDPTKRYNLTFFGSHKYNTNDTTTYSIYTDNTYTTLVSSVNLFVGSGNTHNRDQVAVLNNIAPQTSNILYVQFFGAGGSGEGYLNSMSLSVVPDPSVWDGG
ncbi:MAG TPA: hypothetical protein VFD27_15595, partial [Chthoniobacteraceae bacterium]|nr:hypothetical protein [Chthoniobacteraceae bacterium]